MNSHHPAARDTRGIWLLIIVTLAVLLAVHARGQSFKPVPGPTPELTIATPPTPFESEPLVFDRAALYAEAPSQYFVTIELRWTPSPSTNVAGYRLRRVVGIDDVLLPVPVRTNFFTQFSWPTNADVATFYLAATNAAGVLSKWSSASLGIARLTNEWFFRGLPPPEGVRIRRATTHDVPLLFSATLTGPFTAMHWTGSTFDHRIPNYSANGFFRCTEKMTIEPLQYYPP